MWTEISEGQGHPQLQVKTEANLGCIKPSFLIDKSQQALSGLRELASFVFVSEISSVCKVNSWFSAHLIQGESILM